MKIQLSVDRLTCNIGDEKILKVGESIDYKPTAESVISIGRIKKFKYAGNFDKEDTSSSWMLIIDMGNEKQTEWISIAAWYERFKSSNNKTKQNGRSKKSEDLSQSPI